MVRLESKVNISDKVRAKKIFDGTGNTLLLENLSKWGINLHFLTNGGGAVHVNEHVRPFTGMQDLLSGHPVGFVINETMASYAAASHYISSGRIAVCNFTTGGAADLVSPAITDAKFHNVPVIFLGALSSSVAGDYAPLQDTGKSGFNTAARMKELLGKGCQVIDRPDCLEEVLYNTRDRLIDSKPVAILYHPDVLSQKTRWVEVTWKDKPRTVDVNALEQFLSGFHVNTNGKRVILFVGEEAARGYDGMQELTTDLAEILKAPTLYTQGGVAAVSEKNEFAAGYVMLGHNDYSKELWDSLTPNDTVICLGFDPFEYSTNQERINANVAVLTNYNNPYGSVNDSFKHRVNGEYWHIKGSMDILLRHMIEHLGGKGLLRQDIKIPENLNHQSYSAPPREFVNQVDFYNAFAKSVGPGTIYIGDVSMGYKDFQRVTQKPIPGLLPYYLHQGSLMGQGAGEALGARLANPDKHVHLITGDGCFEYFGASLGRMKEMGLVFWVLDNETHGLVSWGLEKIKPYLKDGAKLTHVPKNDYCKIAEAQGWKSYNLNPDLSNMPQIMGDANSVGNHSILVSVPVYKFDDLGQNPRLNALGRQGRANL